MNILFGWFFFLTNRNNELAHERLKVCAECEFRKWFMCGVCFCPLQMKARVEDEECPKGKWNK